MAFEYKGPRIPGHETRHIEGNTLLECSVILLVDSPPGSHEMKLLENFHKVGKDVYLIFPSEDGGFNECTGFDGILEAFGSIPGPLVLVASGKYAPCLVENSASLGRISRVVLINPLFRKEIAAKMAAFELPLLVVTATPGNLDHDPDAVKYHDLISGSAITYIRGVSGNPLYKRFTQSFNSIQRFLLDD